MIDLPYPHKHLWPNGPRGNIHAVSREKAKHEIWAYVATLEVLPRCFNHNGEQIPVHITVHPKPRGPRPDEDNVVASAKKYIDGIARAMRIDDKLFAAPTVSFAETRTGRFIIEVGHG